MYFKIVILHIPIKNTQTSLNSNFKTIKQSMKINSPAPPETPGALLFIHTFVAASLPNIYLNVCLLVRYQVDVLGRF